MKLGMKRAVGVRGQWRKGAESSQHWGAGFWVDFFLGGGVVCCYFPLLKAGLSLAMF